MNEVTITLPAIDDIAKLDNLTTQSATEVEALKAIREKYEREYYYESNGRRIKALKAGFEQPRAQRRQYRRPPSSKRESGGPRVGLSGATSGLVGIIYRGEYGDYGDSDPSERVGGKLPHLRKRNRMKLVKIVIGQGLDRDGKELGWRRATLRPEALTLAAKVLGGYTTYDGHGGWINPRGELIQERSLTIESYIPDSSVDAVYPLAQELGKIFNQEQVVVVVQDAEVKFVEVGKEVMESVG